MSRSELLDRLKGLLGGRAAEEVIFGEVSTGAENDLQQATALARRAVCQWGMGESVGLMHCAQPRPAFLPGEAPGSFQRDCSEDTARAIDEEVRTFLDDAYAAARTLLNENRGELERVAEALLTRETLDEKEFNALLGGEA
jgi:cell division protease FtsH